MTTKIQTVPYKISLVSKIISCLFGIAVLAAGFINAFWGNDAALGFFLILLSIVYFIPVFCIFKKITGYPIPKPGLLKLLLALFIIWAVIGVGELFDKIELMNADF